MNFVSSIQLVKYGPLHICSVLAKVNARWKCQLVSARPRATPVTSVKELRWSETEQYLIHICQTDSIS